MFDNMRPTSDTPHYIISFNFENNEVWWHGPGCKSVQNSPMIGLSHITFRPDIYSTKKFKNMNYNHLKNWLS